MKFITGRRQGPLLKMEVNCEIFWWLGNESFFLSETKKIIIGAFLLEIDFCACFLAEKKNYRSLLLDGEIFFIHCEQTKPFHFKCQKSMPTFSSKYSKVYLKI